MFGEPHIHPNENLREFYNRLKDLYDKWIPPEKRTKEQVGEILILEQFCHFLSSELRVWVMERDPHSTREETQILEIFLADQQVSKSYQLEAPPKAIAAQGKPLGSGVLCGPRESEPAKPVEKSMTLTKTKTTAKHVCFYCGQKEHIKPEEKLQKS